MNNEYECRYLFEQPKKETHEDLKLFLKIVKFILMLPIRLTVFVICFVYLLELINFLLHAKY